MAQVGLYLPDEVRARLERLRIEKAIELQKIPSISGLITDALVEYFDRRDAEKKTK